MSEHKEAFMSAMAKLEIAERIWKEKRESEYDDAERLRNEAVAIRDKYFPNTP